MPASQEFCTPASDAEFIDDGHSVSHTAVAIDLVRHLRLIGSRQKIIAEESAAMLFTETADEFRLNGGVGTFEAKGHQPACHGAADTAHTHTLTEAGREGKGLFLRQSVLGGKGHQGALSAVMMRLGDISQFFSFFNMSTHDISTFLKPELVSFVSVRSGIRLNR